MSDAPPAFIPNADLPRVNAMKPFIHSLESLAREHGMRDVMQNNGWKTLEIMLIAGLDALPHQGGNDGRDDQGFEYEIKTVDLNKHDRRHRGSMNLTCRTSHNVLARLRSSRYLVGMYRGMDLATLYYLSPNALDDAFARAEHLMRNGSVNNSVSVPLRYIYQRGVIIAGNVDREIATYLEQLKTRELTKKQRNALN